MMQKSKMTEDILDFIPKEDYKEVIKRGNPAEMKSFIDTHESGDEVDMVGRTYEQVKPEEPAPNQPKPAQGKRMPAVGERKAAQGKRMPAVGERKAAQGKRMPAQGERMQAQGGVLNPSQAKLPKVVDSDHTVGAIEEIPDVPEYEGISKKIKESAGKKYDHCWDYAQKVTEESGYNLQTVFSSKSNVSVNAPKSGRRNSPKPGDTLQIKQSASPTGEHNVVFLGWEDETKQIAKVAHYGRNDAVCGNGKTCVNQTTYDLSKHPITVIWAPIPKKAGGGTTSESQKAMGTVVTAPAGNVYDLTGYATDPNHAKSVQSIINNIGKAESESDIDSYIKKTNANSPITGTMIKDVADVYNIGMAELTAILQQESMLGTSNVATTNNNPGGITWNKNFPESMKGTARPKKEGGHYVKYKTMEAGIRATAARLGRALKK